MLSRESSTIEFTCATSTMFTLAVGTAVGTTVVTADGQKRVVG